MPRKKAKPLDPTTAYATSVVEGQVVAGRLVRLACKRHLEDLRKGSARGLVFDVDEAAFTFEFFAKILRLNGGEHEGKPFVLQPWQAFIVGSLFGWKRQDGSRRFRKVYIEIAKGNGKSPLAAGVGLKCLLADNEPRAEIYSAATKKDQAMILFRDAVAMVDQSPALAKVIQKTGAQDRVWNLAHHDSGSWFRPIASDDHSQSGPRPHCALIDEVHEHRTTAIINMLHAGLKGRRQPIIFEITNSGSDRTSICWHHHHYSAQVLEGSLADDGWFAYVCQLDCCQRHLDEGQFQPVENCDDCDDWQNPAVWRKANPNLGVSVTERYIQDQITQAKGIAVLEGDVLRLNFCRWTQVASRAIPADRWTACQRPIAIEQFADQECCAALDIGSTSDFCALALLFPHDDAETVEVKDPENPEARVEVITRRSYSLFTYFWLPEEPRKRDESQAAQIEAWRRAGHIRTTPGNLVDYAQVLFDIKELGLKYPYRKFAIDRGFQGNWIAGQLVDVYGANVVVTFAQGIFSMNPPFREFIELVRCGRMHHAGQPVMDWMAGNCAAETKQGLIKPSKDKSPEKIDGVTAAVMALGVAMTAGETVQPTFFFG